MEYYTARQENEPQPHAAASDSTDADTRQKTPRLSSLTDVKHKKGKNPSAGGITTVGDPGEGQSLASVW